MIYIESRMNDVRLGKPEWVPTYRRSCQRLKLVSRLRSPRMEARFVDVLSCVGRQKNEKTRRGFINGSLGGPASLGVQ